MANDWNPRAPAALGPEWFPTIEELEVVGPSFDVPVQQLTSTAAETVDRLDLQLTASATPDRPLYTVVDVIPSGDEIPPTPVQTAYLLPNADISIGGPAPEGWIRGDGSITNLWSFIDDTPPTLPIDGGNNYVAVRSTITTPPFYTLHIDDSAIPANARILRVGIAAVDSVIGNLVSTFVGYFLQHSATLYVPPNSIFGTHIFGNERVVDCGEINPQTRLPWTRADIAAFNGGLWRISIQGNIGSGGSRTAIWKAALKVEYIATENRVALATWERPASAGTGLVQMPVRAMPAGTANWAKPGSGDHLYLARSAAAPLLYGTDPVATDVRWRTWRQELGATGNPAGSSPPPVPGMRMDRLLVDQYGIPLEPFEGDRDAAAGLYIHNTSPGYSDDSQTYQYGLGQLVALDSAVGNGIAQRLTPGTTANYLGVRFVCFPPASADGTLTVSVRRVSDGVQMGGSFVLSADDVRALPEIPGTNGARYVQGNLSSAAALVAATQYEVRFTTTTSSADDWFFAGPESDGAASVSFGGSTDTARSSGVTLTEQDLEVTLLVQPVPVANVRARPVSVPIGPAGLCKVDSYDQILVEWDPYTALGAEFDHIEIERIIDAEGEMVWRQVHLITDDTTTSWGDPEAPIGTPVAYRVRAVASTAAFSDWATTEYQRAEARGCELIFTSAARPDLTVAYNNDGNQDVGFEFLDHEGDELVQLAGRDYAVAFIEPESRGIGENYRLTLNFGEPPNIDGTPVGRRVLFQPLLTIARAVDEIPYVCVKDHHGNVTYGYIRLSRGVQSEPGWRYSVDVFVRPLTATPAVTTD